MVLKLWVWGNAVVVVWVILESRLQSVEAGMGLVILMVKALEVGWVILASGLQSVEAAMGLVILMVEVGLTGRRAGGRSCWLSVLVTPGHGDGSTTAPPGASLPC